MNIPSLARMTPLSRAQLVNRIVREHWTVIEAAEAAGVSQRTAYKWLARHRSEGQAGLLGLHPASVFRAPKLRRRSGSSRWSTPHLGRPSTIRSCPQERETGRRSYGWTFREG
jgi:transposase-like protein